MNRRRRAAALVLALAAAGFGTGCATLGEDASYLAQAVGGHLDLLRRARPLAEVQADPATPPALRERLALAAQLRAFAIDELALPDTRSYRRFAALGRGAVVWNVVATPELSLTLKTWCWPVVGCVGYRGYFDRERAEATAARLRAEGHEVDVYGVPAYSTLGRTEWLGGDPLLDTFIGWPEGELARLLFHELAHQVLYVADDTAFNEGYATAVERLGLARWLERRGDADLVAQVAAQERRRAQFRALVAEARGELAALYASKLGEAEKRERKAAVFAALRARHAALKAGEWAGFTGYDRWFTRANNATLAIHGAYEDRVPAFERLFEREGRDFARLHAAARALAALPRDERRATLDALAPPVPRPDPR